MLAVNAMVNVSVSSACLPALNNLMMPMFALTIVQSYCSFLVPFVKLSPRNVMHAQAQAPNFKCSLQSRLCHQQIEQTCSRDGIICNAWRNLPILRQVDRKLRWISAVLEFLQLGKWRAGAICSSVQFHWENPLFDFLHTTTSQNIAAGNRSAIVILTPCESIRWY